MRNHKLNTTEENKSYLLQQALKRQTEVPDARRILSPQRDPLEQVTCRLGDTSCANAHASTLHRATASRPFRARQSLLQLQRQYGNRYVQRVLAISRQGKGHAAVAPELEAAIQRARDSGQSLGSGVRAQMESAFGADFSGVRVHTDAKADTLSRALNARAFTVGQDIFFRKGEYTPSSPSGREILSHELTHVVQQTARVRTKLTIGSPDDQYEREADQVAATMIRMPAPVAPEKVAVYEGAQGVLIQCKGFGDYFEDCMDTMGLPAPTSLFGSVTTATATISAIVAAVEKFGTAVTIGELIGAGLLSEALLAAGAVTASFYAGACVGCLSTATGQSLSGGMSLGDAMYELLGPKPGLWLADWFGL